jgi:hypothetical protein
VRCESTKVSLEPGLVGKLTAMPAGGLTARTVAAKRRT